MNWARECQHPTRIPTVGRARGIKAKGLGYERKLARALIAQLAAARIRHGQWFEYSCDDEQRHRFCQPDFISTMPWGMLVLESKLGDVELARRQLSELYFPVLRAAYSAPVRGIIVVRSVARLAPKERVWTSLHELATDCRFDHHAIPVLHWIGSGPV